MQKEEKTNLRHFNLNGKSFWSQFDQSLDMMMDKKNQLIFIKKRLSWGAIRIIPDTFLYFYGPPLWHLSITVFWAWFTLNFKLKPLVGHASPFFAFFVTILLFVHCVFWIFCKISENKASIKKKNNKIENGFWSLLLLLLFYFKKH